MSNQKIVTETALSALASDIKTALSGKANSNDVYPKSQTYNRTEIDNALDLKADKSELYNVYPTEQESGAIASFTDGADNIPVKSLVSQIVAVESGSGEKSPDNPYTISGFDNGIITRCGKNLFDYTQLTSASGWTESGGVYSGAIGNLYLYARNGFPIQPKWAPNQQYVFKLKVNNAEGNSRFRFVYTDNTYSDLVITSSSVGSYISIITEINKTISNLIFFYNLGGNLSISEMCLELETSASTFEAYKGNTYTFTFGQTVYGGHFDNKGEVYSELDLITYDGSPDEGWQKNGEYFYVPVSSDNQTSFTVISNQYQGMAPTNYNAVPNGYMALASGGYNYLNIHDNSYATLEDFKTALSNTNLQVLYKKATPITLSITSQDIPTLLGENNIFSNTGDVEVDYHADIGLYIDKKISSLA